MDVKQAFKALWKAYGFNQPMASILTDLEKMADVETPIISAIGDIIKDSYETKGTPVVKDFQELSKLESFKEFWNNRVIRLLMVVALANLGSMIGTLIAFPYIYSLVF